MLKKTYLDANCQVHCAIRSQFGLTVYEWSASKPVLPTIQCQIGTNGTGTVMTGSGSGWFRGSDCGSGPGAFLLEYQLPVPITILMLLDTYRILQDVLSNRLPTDVTPVPSPAWMNYASRPLIQEVSNTFAVDATLAGLMQAVTRRSANFTFLRTTVLRVQAFTSFANVQVIQL